MAEHIEASQGRAGAAAHPQTPCATGASVREVFDAQGDNLLDLLAKGYTRVEIASMFAEAGFSASASLVSKYLRVSSGAAPAPQAEKTPAPCGAGTVVGRPAVPSERPTRPEGWKRGRPPSATGRMLRSALPALVEHKERANATWREVASALSALGWDVGARTLEDASWRIGQATGRPGRKKSIREESERDRVSDLTRSLGQFVPARRATKEGGDE